MAGDIEALTHGDTNIGECLISAHPYQINLGTMHQDDSGVIRVTRELGYQFYERRTQAKI